MGPDGRCAAGHRAADDRVGLRSVTALDAAARANLAAELGSRILDAIRDDVVGGAVNGDRVTTFADLHDQVDANAYLVAALETLGYAVDASDQTFLDVLNDATDRVSDGLADRILGWQAEVGRYDVDAPTPCPACGGVMFDTIEQITARTAFTVRSGAADWADTPTKVDWDSSRTIEVTCAQCGWTAPAG